MPKRNHHVIPRRYLKGFAIPGKPFIWVFRLDRPYAPGRGRTSNPRRTGLRSAGAVVDAYAVTRSDGEVDFDTYENRFERAEKEANRVWPLLERHEPLNQEHKSILTAYICHLYKRTGRRLREARPLFEQAVASQPTAEYARVAAERGEFTQARAILAEADYASSEQGMRRLLLETADTPYERMEASLQRRTWELLVPSQGRYFVTSDNPVVFDGLAPGRPPLLFPLRQDVLLCAKSEPGKDLGYVDCPAARALQMSALIAGRGEKEFYSPSEDDRIWKAMRGDFKESAP